MTAPRQLENRVRLLEEWRERSGQVDLAEAVVANIWTSPQGAAMTLVVNEEEITLDTGALFTESVGDLLPGGPVIGSGGALILGVTVLILTAITGAMSVWSCGDAISSARFIPDTATGEASRLWVGGQQLKGGVATDALGPWQASAAKVRITGDGLPATGVVVVTVFALVFTAPPFPG